MNYNFLDTSIGKKYFMVIVCYVVEFWALFYIGLNPRSHTPVASFILGFCIGVYILIYLIILISTLIINKEYYIKEARNRKKSTSINYIISGMQLGIFIIWLVLTLLGVLNYGKIVLFYLIGKLILPALANIIGELKIRNLGYSCSEELFLLHTFEYSSNEIVKEYRKLYNNLLLDTNLKENPKAFRKLAQQYSNCLSGYYD